MRRTLIITALVALAAAVTGPASSFSATASAATQPSRIFYSGCPGDYSNGSCVASGGETYPTELLSITPAGGGIEQVTDNASFEQDLIFSPSGALTVFEKGSSQIECDYDSHLARVGTQGGADDHDVTAPGMYRCDEPSDWSPDGGRLLFTREGNLCMDIKVIQANGAASRSLTHICDQNDPDQYAFDGNWARDGHRIVYGVNAYPNTKDGIYVMRSDGSYKHKIDYDGRRLGDFEVSPGTHTIAFASYNSKGAALFTSNINGGDVRRLTPFLDVTINHVRWSPNGERLVFTGVLGNGTGSLYVVSRDTSHFRKLDNPQINAVSLREVYGGYWSPNSERIAFAAEAADYSRHAVATMTADGTDVQVLTPYKGGIWVWGWEKVPW
jgi:Tol biopolymer transport system component